jgi:hypothetical protein
MEDMAMNEYIEMKWRRNGETVRVYNFSVVNEKINSYHNETKSYATIFSRSGKMCGGSGWQVVEVHELTPIEFYNKDNPYEKYDPYENLE